MLKLHGEGPPVVVRLHSALMQTITHYTACPCDCAPCILQVMAQLVARQADDGADGKAEGPNSAASDGAAGAEGADGGGGEGREDEGGKGSGGAASEAAEALLPNFAAAVKRSYTGQLLQVGWGWCGWQGRISLCIRRLAGGGLRGRACWPYPGRHE